MRHRTGLRHRYRAGGVGNYASGKKSRTADRYAKFIGGVPQDTDNIGGHQIWAVRKDTPRVDVPERRTTQSTTFGHKKHRARIVGKGQGTNTGD